MAARCLGNPSQTLASCYMQVGVLPALTAGCWHQLNTRCFYSVSKRQPEVRWGTAVRSMASSKTTAPRYVTCSAWQLGQAATGGHTVLQWGNTSAVPLTAKCQDHQWMYSGCMCIPFRTERRTLPSANIAGTRAAPFNRPGRRSRRLCPQQHLRSAPWEGPRHPEARPAVLADPARHLAACPQTRPACTCSSISTEQHHQSPS